MAEFNGFLLDVQVPLGSIILPTYIERNQMGVFLDGQIWAYWGCLVCIGIDDEL